MARRSRIVWLPAVALAAAIAAGSAQAAGPPANAQLAAWLADNTDVAPAQVALVTPDLIYGLEPLGPRSATDEVVGLARAEAFDGDWASSHGVQSWEAHLLFDCRGKRVRVIRSAEYVQRNRKGRPVATAEQGQWLSPSADQPAATLLEAACDPAFAWPLRTAPTAPAAPVQTASAELAAPKPSPPPAIPPLASAIIPAQSAAATASAALTPPPTFTIQIGRGPSHQGAQEALNDARKVLGPAAAGLASEVEASRVGDRRRFTAILSGFPTAVAAAAACDRLHAGDHHCFVRAAPGPAPNADRDEAAAQLPSAPQPYAAAGPAPTASRRLRRRSGASSSSSPTVPRRMVPAARSTAPARLLGPTPRS